MSCFYCTSITREHEDGCPALDALDRDSVKQGVECTRAEFWFVAWSFLALAFEHGRPYDALTLTRGAACRRHQKRAQARLRFRWPS